MILVYVLLGAFITAIFGIKFITKKHDLTLAARIALSVVLLFTGTAHFIIEKGMAMMLPEFIPYKIGVIYITGVIEIAAAIGLLIPRLQKLTAWLLIIFLILIFPANIYAGVKHIDIKNATNEGPGLEYLWFRVPLQLLLIAWTWFSSLRIKRP